MTQQKNASRRMRRNRDLKVYGSIITVAFFLTVGSVLVGRADEGFIDVSEVMRNSTQARTDGGGGAVAGESTSPPPVNTNPSMPNGGLVGAGKPPKPEPTPEVEEIATSTEESESVSAGGEEPISEDAEAESEMLGVAETNESETEIGDAE